MSWKEERTYGQLKGLGVIEQNQPTANFLMTIAPQSTASLIVYANGVDHGAVTKRFLRKRTMFVERCVTFREVTNVTYDIDPKRTT